jgi:hypothetical protein
MIWSGEAVPFAALCLPLFRGPVDRCQAMPLRLSIGNQPDQDQAPVRGAAEAGAYCALPEPDPSNLS